MKEVDKIFGRKANISPAWRQERGQPWAKLSEVVYSIWGDIEGGVQEEARPKTMMDLTPDEKRKVEGIQLKAAKVGFEAKFRAVYIAKRKCLKAKVLTAWSAMKQFAALDLNNLKAGRGDDHDQGAIFLRGPAPGREENARSSRLPRPLLQSRAAALDLV